MTITYNLAPQPRQRYYYPAGAGYGDLAGQPLSGGKIYTYSSQNHATPKATYQSNVGTPPPAHTNPIILDINGEAAIYWALNDEDTTDLYYIEIYDANSSPPTGTPIITADNYDGASFGETVTPVASIVDFNYIRNAQFSFPWYKTTYNLKDDIDTLPIDTGTWIGADWRFLKNNNAVTDVITYEAFTLGQDAVPDNPIYYIDWNVTATGVGETFKMIAQYLGNNKDYYNSGVLASPDQSVNFASGQYITVQFWAKSNTGTQLTVNFRQYFGTGGSADVVTLVKQIDVTNTFAKYSATVQVPSVAGKTLGSTPGFCQLEFSIPLDANIGTNMGLTNVQLELGQVGHDFQYKSLAMQSRELSPWFQEQSGVMGFRAQGEQNIGWYPMTDTLTFGSSASAATFAKEYAFGAYKTLWNNFDNMYCPVSSGRGASALEDFDAGKTLRVPLTVGRALGNSADGATPGGGITPRQNGQDAGAETHTLTTANLPAHTHGPAAPATNFYGFYGSGSDGFQATDTGDISDNPALTDGGTGLNVTPDAFNIVDPTCYLPMYIKI